MKELYMNFWVFFIWNIKPERINLKIKKIKKKKKSKKNSKEKIKFLIDDRQSKSGMKKKILLIRIRVFLICITFLGGL